jgi:hypothetical protein
VSKENGKRNQEGEAAILEDVGSALTVNKELM